MTDVVTFEAIQGNAEIRTYIEKGNANLGVLGFTKHSVGHAMKVSKTAGEILMQLGYSEREVELARIAGYMHDMGNCINRTDHAHTGALMAMTILRDLGMDPAEIAVVITAHRQPRRKDRYGGGRHLSSRDPGRQDGRAPQPCAGARPRPSLTSTTE